MARLRKVTGTWRGIYGYEISEAIRLDPVPFILILKQGWFGHFKGRVNDDPNLGMPETGRVDGYFSFPKIEFIKLMPVCRFAMADGRQVTLREFLVEKGYPCERDIPHKPIKYTGEFLDPQHAEGVWIIESGPISLGDGRVVQTLGGKGTWKMEADLSSSVL
jgi:hypothetical protein